MKTKALLTVVSVALSAAVYLPLPALAQSTSAFTYQGQLRDGGTNANGSYTLAFTLYDAATAGHQVGSAITNVITLANGLFTVDLDFGTGVFDGGGRWLGITVHSGVYAETLTPRVQVLPSPYALYSLTAGSAAGLSAGTWNAATASYQGSTNVFGITANGALVLGMSTNGAMFTGHLTVADGLDVSGPVQAGEFDLDGGAGITSDGMNGIEVMGTVNHLTAAHVTAGDLYMTNGTLALAGCPTDSYLYSDGNGGITIEGDGVGATHVAPSGINVTGAIDVNSGSARIDPNGNIHGSWFNGLGINATVGCTAPYFNTTSDRDMKEQFVPVDSQDILNRVASLPITSWHFRTGDKSQHIGPMAQDFHAAFAVGTDDRHIATVDEDGVALAAIQGLNQKLKEKEAEIQRLAKRLSDLEARVALKAQ